jgi:hypothetical protein
MGVVSNNISNIRYLVQDIGSLKNYSDAELYVYFNRAIEFLSKELALKGKTFGVTEATQNLTAGSYEITLPSDFLALATDDEGHKRVFVKEYTDVSYNFTVSRLEEASVADMDDWLDDMTTSDRGAPTSFIQYGEKFYVHPVADTPILSIYVIIYYYHPLKSIIDSSSLMPWSGMFDHAIESFVVRCCHQRSEMGGAINLDQMDFNVLRNAANDILNVRDGAFKIRPASNFGWSSQ